MCGATPTLPYTPSGHGQEQLYPFNVNLYNTKASNVTFRPELQAYLEVMQLNPRRLTK